MSQNKYQQLFGLFVQNKKSGLTIEIPENELANIKPALAKLKKQYNAENKALDPEFKAPDLVGNFRYKIQDDQKASTENHVVVRITLEEPPKLQFKVIGET